MPRTFICYDWGSEAYKDWVIRFADELAARGVTVRLDHYHQNQYPGIHEFMSQEIQNADVILVMCTPAYNASAERAQNSEDYTGVGWEHRLITNGKRTGKVTAKVIPVLVSGTIAASVPLYLNAPHVHSMTDSQERNKEFANLLKDIHGHHAEAPAPGPVPEDYAAVVATFGAPPQPEQAPAQNRPASNQSRPVLPPPTLGYQLDRTTQHETILDLIRNNVDDLSAQPVAFTFTCLKKELGEKLLDVLSVTLIREEFKAKGMAPHETLVIDWPTERAKLETRKQAFADKLLGELRKLTKLEQEISEEEHKDIVDKLAAKGLDLGQAAGDLQPRTVAGLLKRMTHLKTSLLIRTRYEEKNHGKQGDALIRWWLDFWGDLVTRRRALSDVEVKQAMVIFLNMERAETSAFNLGQAVRLIGLKKESEWYPERPSPQPAGTTFQVPALALEPLQPVERDHVDSWATNVVKTWMCGKNVDEALASHVADKLQEESPEIFEENSSEIYKGANGQKGLPMEVAGRECQKRIMLHFNEQILKTGTGR